MLDPGLLSFPPLHDWALPAHGLRVETIDAHAGGQPLRLILSGVPPLPGRTMQEKQDYAQRHFDHIRSGLLQEPRGHADMVACLLTPPQHSDSNFGALFWNRTGFSPACGHGIMALTTILLECGIVDIASPEMRLRLDTPAGTIQSFGEIRNGHVDRVFFENGPARVVQLEARVSVPQRGEIVYDLAWNGALFAFVEAAAMGFSISPQALPEMRKAAAQLLYAIRELPKSEAWADEGQVFAVVFTEEPEKRPKTQAHSRQVCIFAHGGVDRSPGGLALSARLALMAKRREIQQGESFKVESIMGSTFTGKWVGRDPRHPVTGGVMCEIEGEAWITGRHSFLLALDDPFQNGFLLP